MKHNAKKTPHYNLERIKDLIKQNHYITTQTAIENAKNDFNINPMIIPKKILELTNLHFYKSMTCDTNNKIWQDVYHLPVNKLSTAYIKLQIKEDKNSVIIQFKRM